MKYPSHLLKLITLLQRFPGVGRRSAERFAFAMIDWTEDQLDQMADVVGAVKSQLTRCSECGCLMGEEGCAFCDVGRRDSTTMCVIASPRDAFALEETGEFRGLYHVLGGLLSPMDDRGPATLDLGKLVERLRALGTREIIIALDSTLEGDATALYLQKELASMGLEISRLAFGLPMGSSLDYVDGSTLARAFTGRRVMSL